MTKRAHGQMSNDEIEQYRTSVLRLVSTCRELVKLYPLKDSDEPQAERGRRE